MMGSNPSSSCEPIGVRATIPLAAMCVRPLPVRDPDEVRQLGLLIRTRLLRRRRR